MIRTGGFVIPEDDERTTQWQIAAFAACVSALRAYRAKKASYS